MTLSLLAILLVSAWLLWVAVDLAWDANFGASDDKGLVSAQQDGWSNDARPAARTIPHHIRRQMLAGIIERMK